MKQITSIFLILIISFLNIGFSVINHYCDGELKGAELSLADRSLKCEMEDATANEESGLESMGDCGMDMATIACSDHEDHDSPGIYSHCCDNNYLTLKIDENYERQQTQNPKNNLGFAAAFLISYIKLFSNNQNHKGYLTYAPPLPEQDIPVLYRSLLL